MKKARCPACGEIQIRYDAAQNNYQCSCGYSAEHHPDLCPTFHAKLGCIFSKSQSPSGQQTTRKR